MDLSQYSFRKNKTAWWLGIFTIAAYLLIHFFRTEGLFSPEWRIFPMNLCRNISLLTFFAFVIHTTGKNKFYGSFLRILLTTCGLLILIDTLFMLKMKIDWKMPDLGKEVKVVSKVNQDINPQRPSFSEYTRPYSTNKEDEVYGYVGRRMDTVISTITVNNVNLPDVFYIFDEFGRRIDRFAPKIEKEKYAIFMGCSVTLGQHVGESETLPACFEKKNPNYRSYNYGISATGPNHYLAMLQNMDIRSQIPEKKGVFIYSFFEWHVNRVISDFQTFRWNNATPYYYLENDELIRAGSFNTGRWFQSLLYDVLNESYYLKYINFNYPKELRDKDYDLTARIIKEMQLEYTRQFNSDRFFVLLLPGFNTSILPYLEKYEIAYIDKSKMIVNYWKSDYYFPIDTHPTGKLYELLSDSLSSDIEQFD